MRQTDRAQSTNVRDALRVAVVSRVDGSSQLGPV